MLIKNQQVMKNEELIMNNFGVAKSQFHSFSLFILLFTFFLSPVNATFTRSDEIVTDSVTGLMWQDNNDAKTITKNWQESIDYCESLTLGNYTDWRLPNKNELVSILDYSKYSPALNLSFVNFTSKAYGSSTTLASDRDRIWYINVFDGLIEGISYKSNELYVRCVRGGQFDSLPIPPAPKVRFVSESPKDYTINTANFTKTWNFSLTNGSVSELTASVVSSEYSSYSTPTITDNGSGRFSISINLTPNTSNPINKIILQLKDSNGNIVKVSGSDTFWAIARTNNPPQFNASQITHIAGESGKEMSIALLGEDIDGDSVSYAVNSEQLTIKNDGGVSKLYATFNDGEVCHKVDVVLSDGKESVTKSLNFLTFTPENLKTFYEDVDIQTGAWKEIYFATLKGIAIGEEGSNPCSRKFRPYDNVTWAEALKMITLSVAKSKGLKLPTATFSVEGPSWVRPYYTFARLRGAIDNNISMYDNPTREEIGVLVSKLLKLQSFEQLNLANIDFTDKGNFSSDETHSQALLTKLYGIYMTNTNAYPKSTVLRSEVAEIATNILRMPTGEVDVALSVEYGEPIVINGVKNLRATAILDLGTQTIKEEWIDTPDKYVKVDAVINKTLLTTNSSLEPFSPITIETPPLFPGSQTIIAMLKNTDGNVRNLITASVNVTFTDSDGDGVQDKNDKWPDDNRYALDENNNNIPDIIDEIYGTTNAQAGGTITINGQSASIDKIIVDGGIDIATYYPDGSVELSSNWQLIALPNDTTINQSSFSSYLPDIQMMWKYKNGVWSAFSHDEAIYKVILSKFQPMTQIEKGEGIWIKNNSSSLAVFDWGVRYDVTTLDSFKNATSGWHLFGTAIDLLPSDIKAANNKIDLIWAYKNNKWLTDYSGTLPNGVDKLEKIDANSGFWVRVK